MSSRHHTWNTAIPFFDQRSRPFGWRETFCRTSFGASVFFAQHHLKNSLLCSRLLFLSSKEMFFKTCGVCAWSLQPESMTSSCKVDICFRYIAHGNWFCKSMPMCILSFALIGHLFNSVELCTVIPPWNCTLAFKTASLLMLMVTVTGQSSKRQYHRHQNSGHSLFDPTALSLCLF